MRLQVYYPEESPKEAMDWLGLAGYDEQKRAIEDCLLLPLQHPGVYDQLRSKTRLQAKGSSRPRAVLFEGPPGASTAHPPPAVLLLLPARETVQWPPPLLIL